MTGNRTIWLPYIVSVYSDALLTERILATIPAAHGPAFFIREPERTVTDWDHMIDVTPARIRFPVLTVADEMWYPEDYRDPKAVRQRFQAYLTALRGREPVFLQPVSTGTQVRTVAGRKGSRAREQRDKRIKRS